MQAPGPLRMQSTPLIFLVLLRGKTNLAVDCVIHTVGPVYTGAKESKPLLEGAYRFSGTACITLSLVLLAQSICGAAEALSNLQTSTA